jgi:YHS domain-containing protein
MNPSQSSSAPLRFIRVRRSLALLLASLAPFATGQPAAPAMPPAAVKIAAKPYPLKTCLVTDNDLDSMGDEVSIVYEGQTIKFCCKPCEKKFRANPEKYLAKLAPKPAAKK